MALYAIGDLHLCLGAPKPMDVFGGAWVGYMDKLQEGLSCITPEDTTVLLGDLSWALSLEEAKADFAWMNRIPGRKIILKGNHDYWWSTVKKFDEFCWEHDEKVFKRELLRLEASLKSAGELPKTVFLHYPPRYRGYECKEILELLNRYEVRRCFYGHLHGASHGLAMEGTWDSVEYRLVSADKLNFLPYQVIP